MHGVNAIVPSAHYSIDTVGKDFPLLLTYLCGRLGSFFAHLQNMLLPITDKFPDDRLSRAEKEQKRENGIIG